MVLQQCVSNLTLLFCGFRRAGTVYVQFSALKWGKLPLRKTLTPTVTQTVNTAASGSAGASDPLDILSLIGKKKSKEQQNVGGIAV